VPGILGRAALAGIVWAGAAGAAAVSAPRVKPGVFLYASPAIRDPNFAETVVLLLQHSTEGSLGLVVNRPTRVPLREAVPDLAESKGLTLRLHYGGPVEPDVVLALVRSPRKLEGAERVLPDVQLSTEPRRWKEVAAEPDAQSRLRVYSGYAGWAPGQLDREMRLQGWVVAPADARSVFSPDPEALWPRVHDLMKRIEARARLEWTIEPWRPRPGG
jgi:putative transcriptional regulator